MASSCSLGMTSTMSCMASAPFAEVAVHALQVRKHRSSLAPNLLPEPSCLQAPRWRPNKLAAKPSAPSNRRTVSLTMARCIRKIETAATTPHPINPVQRVTARFASRADHPRPDPALPPTNGRHRPLAKNDLDLGPAGLDHDAVAGPGKPRVEGVGHPLPLQRDASAALGEGSHGQARGIADEAAIW